MLIQKQACYAHGIIKDGSCVNQIVSKQNMEARNNYLLEKKGTEKKKERKASMEADQVSLTAPVKKVNKFKES